MLHFDSAHNTIEVDLHSLFLITLTKSYLPGDYCFKYPIILSFYLLAKDR